MPPITLFISTRKGLWILRSTDRLRFEMEGPHHLGHIVHHTVLDPRDGRTLLAAMRTGHLGPVVMRSLDGGKSWEEAARPPAFPKGEPRARAVDHVFWLTPGHASQPGVWYAGTSPQGLFRSEDGGSTWSPVSGYNDHPDQSKWAGSDKDQTPDGGKLHSVLVDPRDARHLYVGMSGGGFFESKDEGASWKASRQPWRKAGAVRHARRRCALGPTGRRSAARASLVDGQAPGHDGGRSRSGRFVSRHHERRDLGHGGRRTKLRVRRTPPSRDLRGHGRRMRVIVPTHLRSYTNGESEVDAEGATLADVLLHLEGRFTGIRFRVVDEQDRIRPHVKFFVGGDEAHTLATPVGAREVQIIAALSGG